MIDIWPIGGNDHRATNIWAYLYKHQQRGSGKNDKRENILKYSALFYLIIS